MHVTAEDLAQTTLTKMFVSWRRISRRDAVDAYAYRTLVNTYLADRRGKRARELLGGWLPERPAAPQTPELRIVMLDALATLPPRARVVVVMRYWADLSVDQTAELLSCSPGNAKSQSARALDKLRAVLGESGSLDQVRDERKPIRLGAAPWAIVITPDGKTAYVVNSAPGTVIPIDTATNKAGPPIRVGGYPYAIVITP